ncbi:hypothetical protein, partial [Thiohalocapsa sp. ML1]|uniref:hypothetical protein n=1 Tax=Thiohalocapsa sp. ML1 TaxID=1431688 RepID=UPI0012E346AB
MESCYPFETRLEPLANSDQGGWSILLVNLYQRVQPGVGAWRGFGGARLHRRVDAYLEVARGLGWTLHPYLRQPHGARLRERPFDPLTALSPSTHDALFGPRQSFPTQPIVAADGNAAADPDGEREALLRRLDRRAAGCPHQQPVLLTRTPPGERAGEEPGALDGELALCLNPSKHQPDVDAACSTVFRIQWADLWLFADASGLVSTHNALLALKVEPLRVLAARGAAREVRVGDLAELNRALRDLDRGERGAAWVRPAGSDVQPVNLWSLILEHWLGVAIDQR